MIALAVIAAAATVGVVWAQTVVLLRAIDALGRRNDSLPLPRPESPSVREATRLIRESPTCERLSPSVWSGSGALVSLAGAPWVTTSSMLFPMPSVVTSVVGSFPVMGSHFTDPISTDGSVGLLETVGDSNTADHRAAAAAALVELASIDKGGST